MNRAVLFLEPKGTVLEVIRAAKKRGLHVIALVSDKQLLLQAPLPYRTAIPMIDRIEMVMDWNDSNTLLQTAERIDRDFRVVGVYSGVDPCMRTSALLRARYGLPTPRLESMEQVLNKFELRKNLREVGLSGLKSYRGDEVDGWTAWRMNGPAYFKPVHGAFSAYVRRCYSLEDVKRAKEALRAGRPSDPAFLKQYLNTTGEYHLEQAFEGELLSVEGIARNGEYQALGILSRILYSKDAVVEMGSCFPYPHPLSDKIVDLVRKAHLAVGFSDGPTHTEVIVGAGEQVEIIDLNPRFVGADVLQSINFAYGITIEEHLLDYALGVSSNVTPTQSSFACLQYVLPPAIEIFQSIEFPKSPDVKFTTAYKKVGDRISSVDQQWDYLGCYLTLLPSFRSAISRSNELRREVKVNGNYEGVF